MPQINNLYTYLVGSRRSEVDEWLGYYGDFLDQVARISVALQQSRKLTDRTTYEGTRYESEAEPWPAFAKDLIYKKSNGIASRGQSVLGEEHFQQFIVDAAFIDAVAALIREPDETRFVAFTQAWERVRARLRVKRNPLLVNRTLAACTTEVTSTVNGPDFEVVYEWLVGQKILNRHPDSAAGWYAKNVHLMTFLREAFSQELACGETSMPLLSIFVWKLYENISNPFTLKKQVIRYGAPGTGKTYSARQNTALLFKIWQDRHKELTSAINYGMCFEVVQFHPSYGYEDFIEGLRPGLTTDGRSELRLQNGIFKEFCRRAGTWEVEVSQIPDVGEDLATRWLELTVGDLTSYVDKHLHGPIWRSLLSMEKERKVADVIPPFFFLIDEINRAELSRILGELMLCIEYRGIGGAISTQYAALNTEENGMFRTAGRYKFFIPHNVYLLGTMNTIDRSVESFDLALRRRFRWEKVSPDAAVLRYHLKERDALPEAAQPWVSMANSMESLNARIRATDLLGPDYEIGHAYFMNLQYPSVLTVGEVRERLWQDAIEPLLEEYLRGSDQAATVIPECRKAFGIA